MTSGSQPAGNDAPAPEQRSARLSVAALRNAAPGRMWGGKGCGAPCDFCRVLVSAQEIEYEVEAYVDDELLVLHFHPRCHDAWRAGRESSPESASPEPKSQPSAPAK
jgi:hypothetical protein